MKKQRFIDSFAALGMTSVASLGMTAFLLLAVSCGKGGMDVPEGDPVSFDSSLTETATKALLPNNTTFAVFAWYQPGVIGGAAGAWSTGGWTPNFMYNQGVTFTTPSIYTYAPVKYWPNNEENTLSFWAYCPHNAAGLTLRESAGGSAYANTATTGIPYLDYTTVTGNALIDLMSSDFDASVKDLSKPNLDTPVHLVFRHLLSRIVFHFVKVDDESDDYEVRLTEVSIRGVYQNAGHPGDPSGSWTGHSNNGNITVYADATPLTTDDNPEVDNAGSTDLAVMPIPQILTGTTAKIYISYVVIPSVGDPVPEEAEILITDLHPGWIAPAGWDQNYQYTYNVSITPGDRPIVFSASIVPWEDAAPWVYHYVD